MRRDHDGRPFVRLDTGQETPVSVDQLMRERGPFIDINGEVLTTSDLHGNEQGLIVGIGKTKGNATFYNVEFADKTTEWLAEEQIFLEVRQGLDNVFET